MTIHTQSTAAVGLGLALAVSLAASAAWAGAPHIIEARYSAKLPLKAGQGAWAKAPATPITLFRQRTVRLRDKAVNARLDTELRPRTAEVKALHSATHLALQITWADPEPNYLEHAHYDAFGDAVGVEIPQRFGAGESLPYIGMGDVTHPVVVAVKRAHKDAVHARQFVAAGFGSLTRIERNTDMTLTYDAAGKRWQAVFKRPLEDHNVDLRKGLVPVGIAVWDGGVGERGGNKAIAPWRFVRLSTYPLDQAYLDYVSWGEDGAPVGDAAKGEAIAKAQCIACHRFADQTAAPVGIAPGLQNVGGYAVARYLEESIKTPSAVVLRPLNPNRHYDRTGTRDPHGAYPNAVAYTWSFKSGDGKATSKMPPFAHLSAEDVGNLVAYLKTLKDPLAKEGSK